ncbi:MAG: LytTR family DNA-binding domain-containing protein [Oscillospiraceae bacterium]
MNITINENPDIDAVEVIINCKKVNDEILKMIASLNSLECKITGTKDGQTFLVAPETILYIESVDKKTFIYTENDVFETVLRLYEFENSLPSDGFFRASKSTIINLSGVRSLRPDFGARLQITMNNGEKMTVSRQYTGAVKKRLGL